MIVEGLVVGAVISTFYNVDKSVKMDEKALKKYAKSFEINEEAKLQLQKKAEYTDMRLSNVAKKKRAIVEVTVPQFVEVYGQIQKIELENCAEVNEIAIRNNMQKLAVLDSLSISATKGISDKDFVCGLLIKGIGKMMVNDSERYLSAANSQLRAANVASAQAESIASVYDAVIARADRIAELLKNMNALFTRSIQETKKTIEKNGVNVRNYSEYEKGILMTCVNIAVAMSDLIDVPVVDEKGQICESATEMIITGEQYLNKMQSAIRA
jgi:hypothetical protein